METGLSWRHWRFREKFFTIFNYLHYFMKKNHEQLINCSSTDSDNIARGLHEKTMADPEGDEGSQSPAVVQKRSRKRWPPETAILISCFFQIRLS